MILKGFFFSSSGSFSPVGVVKIVSEQSLTECMHWYERSQLWSSKTQQNRNSDKTPQKISAVAKSTWCFLSCASLKCQLFFFFLSLFYKNMLKKSILLKFTNQNYIQNSFIQSKKHVNCHLKIQKYILYKLISSHFSRSIASAVKGCMLSVSVKATAHWLSGPSVEMRVTEQLEVTVMH